MSPSELSLLELTVLYKWLMENFGAEAYQGDMPTVTREKIWVTMIDEVEHNILRYSQTKGV